MMHIAGQTARPIGLNFLWTLMGGLGVLKAKKSEFFFQNKKNFHGQRRALQLVANITAICVAKQSCKNTFLLDQSHASVRLKL